MQNNKKKTNKPLKGFMYFDIIKQIRCNYLYVDGIQCIV